MNTKTQMIQSLRRLPNSASGNPRWEVFFTDGEVHKTKSDADCNFGISNAENVAPNSVEVTYERGLIVSLVPVALDTEADEE